MCTQISWLAKEKKEKKRKNKQNKNVNKQKKPRAPSHFCKNKSKSYVWRVRKLSFLTSKNIWGASKINGSWK